MLVNFLLIQFMAPRTAPRSRMQFIAHSHVLMVMHLLQGLLKTIFAIMMGYGNRTITLYLSQIVQVIFYLLLAIHLHLRRKSEIDGVPQGSPKFFTLILLLLF